MEYNTKDMRLVKAYKFRLYPDSKRQLEIDGRIILAKEFYNSLLEKSIASYKNGNRYLWRT